MKRSSKDNPRSTITTLPLLPGTLVLCGCTLLLFLGILVAMYAGGMITGPEFLTDLFGEGSGDEGDDGFSAGFLASLNGSAHDLSAPSEELLDLSPDSLKELLLASTPVSSYYQTMEVTWTDGTVFHKTTVHYIVSGDHVHAEIYPAAGTPQTITCNGERFLLREDGVSRVFSRTGVYADFTPEGAAGIPRLSRMQAMIAAAEEGKYELSMETVQDSPCIRVRFTDTLSGVEENFDVLPDLGVILAASSALPGTETPYYQMTTTSILTDLTGVEESTFDIPNP